MRCQHGLRGTAQGLEQGCLLAWARGHQVRLEIPRGTSSPWVFVVSPGFFLPHKSSGTPSALPLDSQEEEGPGDTGAAAFQRLCSWGVLLPRIPSSWGTGCPESWRIGLRRNLLIHDIATEVQFLVVPDLCKEGTENLHWPLAVIGFRYKACCRSSIPVVQCCQ